MSKTISALLAVSPQVVPAGVTPSGFRVELLNPDGSTVQPFSQITDPTTPVLFADVAPGDYVVRASAVGADGTSWFEPVTQAITVPVDTTTSDAPVSIAVTLV